MPRKLTAWRSQRLLMRRKFFSHANRRSTFQRRRYRRRGRPSWVRFRRRRLGAIELDPLLLAQPLVQSVAVIGAVTDHALGQSAYVALAQRVFD